MVSVSVDVPDVVIDVGLKAAAIDGGVPGERLWTVIGNGVLAVMPSGDE